MWSDLKQLIGTVITGLIFSFLSAKLISIVAAIKGHARLPASEFRDTETDRRSAANSPGDLTELASRGGNANSVMEENGSIRGSDENDGLLDGGDGDNDWEEVGSSELDDELSASATFRSGSAQAHMEQVESSSWVMI